MYELLSTFGIFVIISALQLSRLGTWDIYQTAIITRS